MKKELTALLKQYQKDVQKFNDDVFAEIAADDDRANVPGEYATVTFENFIDYVLHEEVRSINEINPPTPAEDAEVVEDEPEE